MNTHQADITLIGGGMVGLSMALALEDSGASVCLVDNQPPGPVPAVDEPLPFSPRVSALSASSIAFLESLGAWQYLPAAKAGAFSAMQVWDGEGTAEIHFDAAEIWADQLGVIVENSEVVMALEAALAGSGVTVVRPAALLDLPEPGVVSLDNGDKICSRLVIGADGGRSTLRELAGFRTREWDYPHRAIVTTVTTALPHGHTAWQRFMHSGPLAFLPLAAPPGDERHYCSIVWSCLPALCDELMALDDAAFRRRLGAAFEYRLGEVGAVNRRFAIPLRQRHATEYVKPGLALIGDAAHTIHPLAGQGVNLGLQDAETLATVLRQALRAKEDPGHLQVLSRYQRQRKVHNLGMMAAMEGFARLFGSQDLGATWLRNAGMKVFGQAAPARREIMRRAMGL